MHFAVRATPSSKTGQLSEGGLTAVVLSTFFSVIAIIAVGLRFWVRRRKRIGPLLEDWLILAALVCYYQPLALASTSGVWQQLIADYGSGGRMELYSCRHSPQVFPYLYTYGQ